ncbi:hypothetical protein XENOCAPTIV_025878 [Xenoophorus captivus]|uniref:P-type ATPase N-terminal domain-containing protein n=1 Tax=Xenoophorus captivus TaxID=1517983 RepID=A0ABV0Q6Y2_9TELE
MERFQWVRHRCRQLLAIDSERGWYSPPDGLPSKSSSQKVSARRRTVLARHGPHQEEYEAMSKKYKGNSICTTKYSLLTFIPMNLFQQFHRITCSFGLLRAANLYFLFLALLNWVPVVEAFEKEITMIPLLVVLTVIGIKDALEDYRRYLFDKKVNNNLDHLKKRRTVVPSFTEEEELKEHLKLYKRNKIRTTKYSFLSFLPKNLFVQLHRFANVYFIFLAALNFVPVVEAFQPEVSLIPIILVLTVTAIKDIFEDYRRFKSDRFINHLPSQVYCRYAPLVL